MPDVAHTSAELEQVRSARSYIHAEACPVPAHPCPCMTCPDPVGLLYAIRVLRARPRDARAARRALHDVVCMSGCGPESGHADRTQAKPVAALRRYLRDA